MGHIPIKYLRFSLLVASVFIFAGSARASENKTTDVSVQSGGKVVIDNSSSTTTSHGGGQSNSISQTTSLSGLAGSNSDAATLGGAAHVTQNGSKSITDSDPLAAKSDTVASASSADQKAVGIISDPTKPLVSQGVASDSAKVIPTVQARLAATANRSQAGIRSASNYYVQNPVVSSNTPATRADSQSPAPALPMSQSEMLIASLSQLLLSPNVVQKLTGLSMLAAGVWQGVSSFSLPAIAITVILASLIMIGSVFLTTLRRTGFWHGARSGELDARVKFGYIDKGLAAVVATRNCQTLFISEPFFSKSAYGTGGQQL